jgi:hypothetical protein
MRKTPKEIADGHNQFETEAWLLSASTEEICGFFTHTSTDSHDFQFARAALDVRIAKSAERTNCILVWLTVFILILTAALVFFELCPNRHG